MTCLMDGAPVDLLLVDWNMPVMNGYELVRAVRANPVLCEVRIMMVATETSLSQVALALEAGADEYLMKPFVKESVFDKLAILGMT
jgi:two-component system chemotaxis response regulator CheY